jgi:cytochrome c oxidase subunit 3
MTEHSHAGTMASEPYITSAQQHEAARLGMWLFLATELLLFGALFTGYTMYRLQFHAAFTTASGRLDLLLGSINTALLLTSSFTMALADAAAADDRRHAMRYLLAVSAGLGLLFLAIKGLEYSKEINEGLVPFLAQPFAYQGPGAAQVKLFFNLYFVMTALHALHLLIGIGLAGILILQSGRRHSADKLQRRSEVTGLYWHFVDIVWIFLFPMLYLV